MSFSLLALIGAVQRYRVYFFYDSINWLQYGLLVVLSVISYTVVCYLLRLRVVKGQWGEPDYQLPKPDVMTIAVVAIADALIRFVTVRIVTAGFTTLYGGAIPLDQALFVELCTWPPFLLCSFIAVMLISKALLPTTIGQAMLVAISKILLQLVLVFLTFGLMFVYASS